MGQCANWATGWTTEVRFPAGQDIYLRIDQGWANFFVGGPNEKSKMSGGPT
jgi:hypothetical protein